MKESDGLAKAEDSSLEEGQMDSRELDAPKD